MIPSKKTVAGGAHSRSARRVKVYCRRSKDDGDQTVSLPEQEAECRRYAEAEALGEVIGVERENRSGVSGFDRPVFMKMIASAERGEFDVFLTCDLSRFGRFEPEERGYWITRLKQAGVQVNHVHDDARLQGEAGQIMGAVLQQGMNEQSRKTGLRVAMGVLAAVERGCWPGGPPSFGYALVRRKDWKGQGRRDATVVVVKNEAKVVMRIFLMRADDKLGYETIARRLNDSGCRTRAGRLWSASTVKIILRNQHYKGELVRGGEARRNPRAKFFQVSAGGVVAVGKEAKAARSSGIVPAIVSDDLWERAQAVGSDMKKCFGGRPRGPSKVSLLAGLTACGGCGGALVAAAGSTTPQKRFSYMICAAEARGAPKTPDCTLCRVRRDRLHEAVLDQARQVASRVDPVELRRLFKESLKQAPLTTDVDVSTLEARRNKLAERRRALVLGNTGDAAFVTAAVAELAEEDRSLALRIEAAKRSARATEVDVEALVDAAVEAAVRLEANESEEGMDALRAALAFVVEEVRVLPGVPLARTKPVQLRVRTPRGMASGFTNDPSPPTDELGRPVNRPARARGLTRIIRIAV